VQVDPIKPMLKAPGIKLLKLKYDKPLSNFAFKFNLRRYSEASVSLSQVFQLVGTKYDNAFTGGVVGEQAGAYTRSLYSST